jgi:hypothetical protein
MWHGTAQQAQKPEPGREFKAKFKGGRSGSEQGACPAVPRRLKLSFEMPARHGWANFEIPPYSGFLRSVFYILVLHTFGIFSFGILNFEIFSFGIFSFGIFLFEILSYRQDGN